MSSPVSDFTGKHSLPGFQLRPPPKMGKIALVIGSILIIESLILGALLREVIRFSDLLLSEEKELSLQRPIPKRDPANPSAAFYWQNGSSIYPGARSTLGVLAFLVFYGILSLFCLAFGYNLKSPCLIFIFIIWCVVFHLTVGPGLAIWTLASHVSHQRKKGFPAPDSTDIFYIVCLVVQFCLGLLFLVIGILCFLRFRRKKQQIYMVRKRPLGDFYGMTPPRQPVSSSPSLDLDLVLPPPTRSMRSVGVETDLEDSGLGDNSFLDSPVTTRVRARPALVV